MLCLINCYPVRVGVLFLTGEVPLYEAPLPFWSQEFTDAAISH